MVLLQEKKKGGGLLLLALIMKASPELTAQQVWAVGISLVSFC